MTFKFGKLPRKSDFRTLSFGSYVTPALQPAPEAYISLERVAKALDNPNVWALFPVDGNDVYADCTVAALAHAITVWRGLLGQESVMPAEDVVALYLKLSGGVDSGLAELTVLKYWRKNAVGRDAILAYVSIDPSNHEHVRQAIATFGAVYLGFQVTQDCLLQFNEQTPWQPGPKLPQGHAVVAVGYTNGNITLLTWGGKQIGSWPWWDACVVECYGILPPEAADPNFLPGFELARLHLDLVAVSQPDPRIVP